MPPRFIQVRCCWLERLLSNMEGVVGLNIDLVFTIDLKVLL
jgi:hypothetical protein